MAAPTMTPSQLDDWTAVAQNVLVESTNDDFSANHASILTIYAALDTTTAHTGTKFKIQTAGKATDDEDWADFDEITGLIGTAATDLIEDNPLAASATTITLTGHALTTEGVWLFIEDGTLINSELVYLKSQTANQLVLVDGTTNSHAQNTAIFNVVMTAVRYIPMGVGRIRVLVDNTFDDDGSSLNFKITVQEVTDIS